MKKFMILVLFQTYTFLLLAQHKEKKYFLKDSINWFVNVEAGMAYNFFVFYDEPIYYNDQGYIIPEKQGQNYRLLQKNPVGTYWGTHFGFKRGKNLLVLGYSRSRNIGKYKFETLAGQYKIIMDGLILEHLNNFYSLVLYRDIKGKHKWYWLLGVYYLRLSQNEVYINNEPDWLNPDKSVSMLNRDYKGYGFEDGGIIGGIVFSIFNNKYYHLVMQAKVFYSTGSNIWELISFGPMIIFKL